MARKVRDPTEFASAELEGRVWNDGRMTVATGPAAAFTIVPDKVKGMPRISSKNQITLPVATMRAAGVRPGDEITVRAVGDGEIVVAVRGARVRRHAGIATDIYAAGELEELRDEWER